MYIVNGIAYAGEKTPPLKVCGIRPLENHKLWIRFNTGEAKIFDFSSLLNLAIFAPLADPLVFNGVYIDYGVPVWLDGDIDISPELLYQEGIAVDSPPIAK